MTNKPSRPDVPRWRTVVAELLMAAVAMTHKLERRLDMTGGRLRTWHDLTWIPNRPPRVRSWAHCSYTTREYMPPPCRGPLHLQLEFPLRRLAPDLIGQFWPVPALGTVVPCTHQHVHVQEPTLLGKQGGQSPARSMTETTCGLSKRRAKSERVRGVLLSNPPRNHPTAVAETCGARHPLRPL